MEIKKTKVHIVPVGFEEDRAVHGLINIGADKIYLLTDNKKNVWGEEARKHAEVVKKRLKDMAFNHSSIIEVPFDPTDFESSRKCIKQILEKEKEESQIYINISSSTKLCAVAFTLAALTRNNAFLYYVVPEHYTIPPNSTPLSTGVKRLVLFSPREIKFGEVEDKILDVLSEHKIGSLMELNKHVFPDDINKAAQAKLSYYVRKLEKESILQFKQGREISLTEIGQNRISSFKDDAKLSKPRKKVPR